MTTTISASDGMFSTFYGKDFEYWRNIVGMDEVWRAYKEGRYPVCRNLQHVFIGHPTGPRIKLNGR